MFGADKGSTGPLDGKNLHIGVVQARFNEGITNALWDACHKELLALGVQEKRIHHITVPGALEVATALQALAERDEFDALIALAASSVARPTTSSWWPTNRDRPSRASRSTTRCPWPTPS